MSEVVDLCSKDYCMSVDLFPRTGLPNDKRQRSTLSVNTYSSFMVCLLGRYLKLQAVYETIKIININNFSHIKDHRKKKSAAAGSP